MKIFAIFYLRKDVLEIRVKLFLRMLQLRKVEESLQSEIYLLKRLEKFRSNPKQVLNYNVDV